MKFFHKKDKICRKNILPLSDVEINAWPEQNFLFGIVKGQNTGTDWLMNHFIQLRGSHYVRYEYGDIDSSITFYPYNIHQLTPNMFDLCPFIDKYTLPRSFIKGMYGKFDDFIKIAIDNGFYLSTFLDQFFRNDLKGKIGFHHPTFIYGYDSKRRLIYIADNFENGKYGKKVISYDQMDRAFELIEDDIWEVSVFLYKLKPFQYNFISQYIKEQIADYLEPGKGVCYFNRTVCPETVHRDENYLNEIYYGIDCYKLLDRYLDAVLNHDENYLDNDWRSLVQLCDHKYLMIERYKYMEERSAIIKNVELFSNLRNLEKECKIALNMFIKYTITKDYDLIKRLKGRIEMIKVMDKECMERFYKLVIT